MFLFRLSMSHVLARKARSALTVAAVALAISLVVSVTTGYRSAVEVVYQFVNRFIGTSDAQIIRDNDRYAGIDQSLLQSLRADPLVRSVIGRLELDSGLIDKLGHSIERQMAQVLGIARPADKQVESLRMEKGRWFEQSDVKETVIDQAVAELLNITTGDALTLPGPQGGLKLTVVGIVHKPDMLAKQMKSIYVPLQTLQRYALPDKPAQVSRIFVELKRPSDSELFQQRWEGKLKAIDPLLRVRLAGQSRKQMEKNLQGVKFMSYLAGAVSMLAAGFIIFTTLSMGVSERSRTLAMLRAVGATRKQVGISVLMEAALLAGLGALVGVPLGILWITLLARHYHELFSAGVVVSGGGVVFGGGGALLAALAAGWLPAMQAMRLSPLAALGVLGRDSAGKIPWRLTVFGLLLLGLDPLLLSGPMQSMMTGLGASPALTRGVEFYGHFILGVPGVFLGVFFLSPLMVKLVEWLLARPVALVLGINSAMLRRQLSGGLWRSAGTATALMVGLAVLVVMQAQGRSMLAGWQLPDKFPDIFIFSPLRPLSVDDQKKIQTTPGIRDGQVLPVAIASPEFGNNLFAIAGASMLPDATLFFGLDIDRALEMIDLDFRQGDPAQVRQEMKKGRRLIVTNEFHQLRGLNVGDSFPLKTPRHGVVNYTIAAVVWSPGIDVIVGMFDMGRQFEQRTIASVFGTLENAREDFGADHVYFFAANLEYGLAKEKMLANLQRNLGAMGLKAGDVRQIKENIQTGFSRLLLVMSSVAFAAMAVASLGVVNTLLASVRSRRWELGILRAVGATRWQVVRWIVAESLLLGIVGCLLGLVAGLQMTLMGRQMNRVMVGLITPLVIPWTMIGIGVGVVMAVALLAGLWPAVQTAATRPLRLLQSGRAAE